MMPCDDALRIRPELREDGDSRPDLAGAGSHETMEPQEETPRKRVHKPRAGKVPVF